MWVGCHKYWGVGTRGAENQRICVLRLLAGSFGTLKGFINQEVQNVMTPQIENSQLDTSRNIEGTTPPPTLLSVAYGVSGSLCSKQPCLYGDWLY